MITYRVFITEPAEAELRSIVQYISFELKEPMAAQNLAARIGSAILELESMPLRNELVRDERLASLGIRILPIDNYSVFYFVSEINESVTIVRILYSKREWSNLL